MSYSEIQVKLPDLKSVHSILISSLKIRTISLIFGPLPLLSPSFPRSLRRAQHPFLIARITLTRNVPFVSSKVHSCLLPIPPRPTSLKSILLQEILPLNPLKSTFPKLNMHVRLCLHLLPFSITNSRKKELHSPHIPIWVSQNFCPSN